ncbi:8745_t:CDS:2 [Ambispora gerdemannii]|uniref:8745_t:CDS:1 n=1 Tax=Ambispora gerdemannii TaxID=144530 RepID=A0A9N9EBW8_9GLOM|nr:8745_t:CDS:2 [Ambispora gerdemannii]
MTNTNNPELEKLDNFLIKYEKIIKEEVSRCDEKLESVEINEKQKTELRNKKQELETKFEKAQSYLDKIRIPENLCERYGFKYGDDKKPITLDIIEELSEQLKLNPEENFYVAEEVLEREEIGGGITLENKDEIFLKSHLIEEETNKGKFIGVASGIGTGAAGGAAAGAGLMVALSPWTFGLSLSLIPTAAAVGAVAGGLGGGTTGFMAGLAFDKLSNSEKIEIKNEIKGLLEDYKTMMEEKSRGCQDIINNEVSESGEKEESQKQKENYDNEVKEIVAYIENNNN